MQRFFPSRLHKKLLEKEKYTVLNDPSYMIEIVKAMEKMKKDSNTYALAICCNVFALKSYFNNNCHTLHLSVHDILDPYKQISEDGKISYRTKGVIDRLLDLQIYSIQDGEISYDHHQGYTWLT